MTQHDHRKEDGYYAPEEYRRYAEEADPDVAFKHLQEPPTRVPKKTQRSIARKKIRRQADPKL